MLQLKQVKVRYKDSENWVLHDINFFVKPGDIVLIVGPSGSGKTTLARTITGLIPNIYPGEIAGEIIFENENITGKKLIELKGAISYVGQNPELFTVSLRVFDEIATPLVNLGYPKKEIIRRINFVSELLRIKNMLNKLTTELSAGQLQKIAIASAIVTYPKVMVLDEPFARLDKRSAVEIAKILRKLADNGTSILVFEHHLDEILKFANRVVVINHGTIVFSGRALECISYIKDIDLPEITEVFLMLKTKKIDRHVPLSVDEAVRLIDRLR